VKGEEKIASPPAGDGWTRPEAYIGALARKRGYRRSREDKPRSQPIAPRPSLSTVPFAAILAVLAVLAVAIMFVAFPGNQPAPRPKLAEVHEQGVAAPGWFQEARKQFHE
jgi:hypothetical protein